MPPRITRQMAAAMAITQARHDAPAPRHQTNKLTNSPRQYKKVIRLRGEEVQPEPEPEVEDDGSERSEDIDVEAEDEDEEQNVDDDDEEEELEDDEDGEGESDDEEPVAVAPTQPRLKITLKLPVNTTSSNGTDAETDYAAFKRTPKRRAKAKVIQDIDIESEDPSSPSDSDDEQSLPDAPSRSTGTPSGVGGGTKSMTTRQAVLASVVDPSHVSLNEGTRSKKQPLNETELALRREETARKRKNLSEKKLEDEKAETINRLLKKQSRPKNKRTNTTDDRSPMPAKSKNVEDDGEADDDDDAMDVVEQPEEVKPVMYRWVSSLRTVPTEGGEQKVEMGISFSVPENLIPPVQNDAEIIPDEHLEKIRAAKGPGVCAVSGCGKPRKYRLPKDWTIGACDSTHLRILAN